MGEGYFCGGYTQLRGGYTQFRGGYTQFRGGYTQFCGGYTILVKTKSTPRFHLDLEFDNKDMLVITFNHASYNL